MWKEWTRSILAVLQGKWWLTLIDHQSGLFMFFFRYVQTVNLAALLSQVTSQNSSPPICRRLQFKYLGRGPLLLSPAGTDWVEVPTIYKAYILGLCQGVSPKNMALYSMVQYLHFRILEFSLIIAYLCGFPANHMLTSERELSRSRYISKFEPSLRCKVWQTRNQWTRLGTWRTP